MIYHFLCRRLSRRAMVNVHAVLVDVWFVLVAPTLLLWRDSIPWLAFMSVYACFVGHFGSAQAAAAELEASDEPSDP